MTSPAEKGALRTLCLRGVSMGYVPLRLPTPPKEFRVLTALYREMELPWWRWWLWAHEKEALRKAAWDLALGSGVRMEPLPPPLPPRRSDARYIPTGCTGPK